jgi:hypothetical protein
MDCKNAKKTKDIIQLGLELGLSKIKTWPISSRLHGAKGKVILLPEGWELTSDGIDYVSNITGIQGLVPPSNIAMNLRKHLSNISNPDTKKFLEEAIISFEYNLYRSAIVLSWVGALSILYDWVISNKLVDFNTEMIRRNSNLKPIKVVDDFGRIKEKDFLEIISSISVIGKNVRQELEKCLTLRNSCGHPNSLKISQNVASAHIEILALNVFEKFC